MLSEALNLTILGMGFVFTFLTVLVAVISAIHKITQKIRPIEVADINSSQGKNLLNEINQDVKTAIEKAIKLHRGES
jgi:oxaloacetate decarboxylase gamma subunit